MDWKDNLIILFGIISFMGLGVIGGIFIGYYALPHTNYNLQLNGGNYTLDYGPNAAKLIETYYPTISSSESEIESVARTPIYTKLLDDGSQECCYTYNGTYEKIIVED